MSRKTPKKKRPLKRNPQSKTLTFRQHLEELRSRILWVIFSLIIGTIVGYLFHKQITEVLIAPLAQPIFYVSPAGGFDFVLKISLFFGFLVSIPVFVYQTTRFIEPALPKKYPRLIITTLLASSLLLLIGMSFAYMISLPAALYFLNKFATEEVRSLITASEYFTFITRYILGFGLIFQLPLIVITVNTIQKIHLKSLLKYEKWIVLASFLLAAIITPTPDIFNQLIMALPLILLYQLSIVVVVLQQKLDRK